MRFFSRGKIVINSPVSGEVVALGNVPDPVFASEMLGKGIAVIPSEGKVYAPVSGKVVTVFTTKHAIGLVDENGVEVLIHIGLDTVNLSGQHFTSHVKGGDIVKAGQLLSEFDISAIKNAGYDVITPVIITNSPVFKEIEIVKTGQVGKGEEIVHIKK